MNLRLAFLTALLFTIFSTSAFCKEENQVSFIKPYCLAAKATGDFTLTVRKVRNLLMNGKL